MKILQFVVSLLCISLTLQGCVKPSVAVMELLNEDNGQDLNQYREICLAKSNQPTNYGNSYYQECYIANFADNLTTPRPRLWVCCCDIGPRKTYLSESIVKTGTTTVFNENRKKDGIIKKRFKKFK